MKKKLSFAFVGLVILGLTSCSKENAQAVKPEAEPDNVSLSTMSAGGRYDYSQSIEQIIKDATIGVSDQVKEVITDETYGVEVIPGEYMGELPCGEVQCYSGSICEIIVTADPKVNQVYSGTKENPIGVIQTTTGWPTAKLATSVSYTYNEAGIHVSNEFID